MRLERYLITEANATDKTRLQESLGCVAFGIYQLKRKKITESDILDKELFGKSYDQFCQCNASVDELYKFAVDDMDYVKSAVAWANALFSSGYTKGTYTFYRGKGFMELVYKEFNRLKADADIKFKNDKWNPGDVWASKVSTFPSFSNITELNQFISDSISKGSILPISLKKVTKSADVHHIKPSGEGDIAVGYEGIEPPKQGMFPTGMTLKTTKGNLYINFRSFRISKQADITGELIMKGTSARHGKVPSSLLHSVISEYGIPQMNKQTISKTDEGELKEYVRTLWAKCGHSFSINQMNTDFDKERKGDMQDTTGYWQSIIHALELGAWLNGSGKSNDIVSKFYIGASSTDSLSSEHLKIY